jgi:DNA-binding MarR family transcriptional regulator
MTRHARLDLDHFLPYRLSVLSNRLSQAIARHYETRFGLSVTEWRVMAVLGLEPGLSASEVAERTAMDKVAVSRAVNALLGDDRLERQFHGNDRRRSILRLSEAGQAIYDAIVPMALGFEAVLLADLTAEEREQLDRLLHKLGANGERAAAAM